MSNRNWERLGNAALAVLIILVGVVYAMDAAKRYDERLEKSAKLRGWDR